MIIIMDEDGALLDELNSMGFETILVKLHFSFRRNPIGFLKCVRRIHTILRGSGACVCYGNGTESLQLLAALRVLSLFSLRTVQHFRDAPWQSLCSRIPQIMLQSVAVFNSQWTMDRWIPKNHRWLCGSCVVVYNAADLSGIKHRATGRLSRKSDEMPGLILTMLGRFRHDSGMLFPLQALKDNLNVLQGIAEIRMIGAGERDEASFCSQLHDLLETVPILAERVKIIPWTTDRWAYLNESDIILCPRHDAPFGRIIVEAGALGKCVLAANGGGHAEIMCNGFDGAYWEPGNTQDFVNQLGRLTASRDGRARLGANLLDSVKASFDSKVYAKKIFGHIDPALPAE